MHTTFGVMKTYLSFKAYIYITLLHFNTRISKFGYIESIDFVKYLKSFRIVYYVPRHTMRVIA